MSSDHDQKATLLRAEAGGSRPGRMSSAWSLAPDLGEEAVRRIRTVALLYATAYFLVGLLPALLTPEGRAMLFGRTIHWLPAILSIVGALAAWTDSPRRSKGGRLYPTGGATASRSDVTTGAGASPAPFLFLL